MENRLEESTALRANLEAVQTGLANSPNALDWYHRLSTFLDETRAGFPGRLTEPDFLARLWDDNPVSAVGNGTVKIGPALSNKEFVAWFAGQASKPLPSEPAAAELALTTLYDEMKARLGPLCGRVPHLKLNRVLCALYPEHFTSLADVGALLYLHRQMGGSGKDHPVHAHGAIRRRIDETLGPVNSPDPLDRVRRMCLPWWLYERITSDKPGETEAPDAVRQSHLVPLPASLRRKGLTAIKGGLQTLLSFLPALDKGVTRDEFTDLIREDNPDLAPVSIGSTINVISREFDLCARDGDIYRLSARGINLLQSQDPHELADHLLTRVLGVDNVVHALASGPQTRTQLVLLLQKVNPGWTSDFAPKTMLYWLASLGVISFNEARQAELTDLGRRWNELITWEPESLPAVATTIEELSASLDERVSLPTWGELSGRLRAAIGDRLTVDDGLVKQLHAGLWFHPVRHFAVLTGISGSGKTQLALNYANALCGDQVAGQESVKVIPIQPGWFEPSPLLGYVNPIQQSAYRSAPFLELMLRAAENPERPYVAILDEMNLSHPEQYLAPVLSAMETHGSIDLHQLAEGSSEIPRAMVYPANLAIIGTINMDETTVGLSDKVLDRAYTLEFWNINVADFPRWKTSGLSDSLRLKAQEVLQELGGVLAPVRLHFGWRTIDDVLSYLVFAADLGTADSQALDDVLYAKLLPKLRGESSKRFEKAVVDAREVLKRHGLIRCYDKLGEMQADLLETGTTRFWR